MWYQSWLEVVQDERHVYDPIRPAMYVSIQLLTGLVAGFMLGGCCLTGLTLLAIGAWASGVAWREIGEPDEPQPPPITGIVKRKNRTDAQ